MTVLLVSRNEASLAFIGIVPKYRWLIGNQIHRDTYDFKTSLLDIEHIWVNHFLYYKRTDFHYELEILKRQYNSRSN